MQAATKGGEKRDVGNVVDLPSYDAAHERIQPFTEWAQKPMIWFTFATELNQGQQASAIFSQLRGEAGIMAQNLSQTDITQRGILGGVQNDPVQYLLFKLTQASAPLNEKVRRQPYEN